MSIPSLDQLRDSLRYFDLKPLFLVVAGNHKYGFPVPDPVVRVPGCHKTALEAMFGEGTNRELVEVELAVAGMDVRIRSEHRRRVVERIRAQDAEFIEALHSPLVIVGHEEVRRLREAASRFLTKDLYRTYRERALDALSVLERRKAHGVTDVLFLYRALLTGIHLLETGRMVVDLGVLIKVYDLPFLVDLVRRPDRPPMVGDPARMGFLLSESERLFERLDRAARASQLPAEPVRTGALSAWIEE